MWSLSYRCVNFFFFPNRNTIFIKRETPGGLPRSPGVVTPIVRAPGPFSQTIWKTTSDPHFTSPGFREYVKIRNLCKEVQNQTPHKTRYSVLLILKTLCRLLTLVTFSLSSLLSSQIPCRSLYDFPPSTAHLSWLVEVSGGDRCRRHFKTGWSWRPPGYGTEGEEQRRKGSVGFAFRSSRRKSWKFSP